MNKKILKIGMNCCIIAMWIVIIIGIYQAVGIYNYFQEHPQKEFEWSRLEAPPQELLIKSSMINAAKMTIWIGMLFAAIFYTLDYFRDKENHFVTYLIEKVGPAFEKLGDKLEDDEDENKD